MSWDDLQAYEPEVDEPADFDRFWADTLTEAATAPLDVVAEPADDPVVTAFDVRDVRFTGYGGTRVAAWLYLPHEIPDDAPLVVEFIGYNGGRGRPHQSLGFVAAGLPHLLVDSRGQGGGWTTGDTTDDQWAAQPGVRSFLTSGLASPIDHYYRRIFTDASRAMSVAGEIAEVAGRPIVSTGRSQGGALSLAAAALSRAAAGVAADVTFLSNFRRAVDVAIEAPYSEIGKYLMLYPEREPEVFATLAYFDVSNHAKRIAAPGLFSIGLSDPITPSSTVWSAYFHYAGEKSIEVYPFNAHDGADPVHFPKKVAFARRIGSALG